MNLSYEYNFVLCAPSSFALAEKRYRRSVAVLQHKLKSEEQIELYIRQTRAGGQDGWNWSYFGGPVMKRNTPPPKKKRKRKKERSQYSAVLTEQSCMKKDLSHSHQRIFLVRQSE